MSRQKELHTDPKSIQQIEFIEQFKKTDVDYNATDAGNDQSACFNKFRKNQTKLKFSHRSIAVL